MKKHKRRKSRRPIRITDYILIAISLLMALYCSYTLFSYAGAVPAAVTGLVSVMILVGVFLLIKNRPEISLVLLIIYIIIALAGVVIGMKADQYLSKISAGEQYETVQIVALKDSPVTAEDDFSDYRIAYTNSDPNAYQRSSDILMLNNKQVKKSIPYKSSSSALKTLKTDKNQLMVLTNMVKSDLAARDEDYMDDLKVLFEKDYILDDVNLRPVNISKEPFTVYLQGADLSSGENINSTGRGDVNILLTINPETEKVNLQAIPRDTFVNIPSLGGRSKLSYSGWWGGVQSSIESIEEKFDVEINYYCKINFNGLIDLVDALGGVDAYSHYTYNAGPYHFTEGYNHMNGDQALYFARERKSLPENELSRGYHQMELIKAIFKKFGEDPSYDKMIAVLDTLTDNFITNLPEKNYMKAYKLVMKILPQLQEMEIHSMEGHYDWHYDEVRPEQYKYYYIPDESEVERVKNDIDAVLEGK